MSKILPAWLFLAAAAAQAAGGRWAQVGPPGFYISSLAIDPIQASTLYAGGGIFKSSDYGVTWALVYSAPSPLTISVSALAVDAGPGRAVLAGGLVSPPFRAVQSNMLRSADNGLTWAATGPLSYYWPFITPDRSVAGTFYAGTDADLLRTRDGGLSWEALPVPRPFNAAPSSLAIDPRDHNVLLLGLVGGGILRSSDGGASWQPGNAGLAAPGRTPSVSVVALDPTNPSVAYAAGAPYTSIPYESYPDFFRSTDGGLSWTSIAALAGTPNVQSIAVALTSPATVSIATSDLGVLQSQDHGDTWAPVNAGLPSLNVSRVWASENEPGVLYAASAGRLYRLGSHDCVESPTAIATATTGPICPGQTATLSGSGGVQCSWSPPDGLLQQTACVTAASPSATTVYSLVVKDAFGCPSSNPATVVVTVLDAPPAPPITAPTSAPSGQRGLAASVPGHAGNAYRWSVSNGTIESGQGTNAVTFAVGSAGTTSLSVNETNSIGCGSPDSFWNITVNPTGSPCSAGPKALCLEGRFRVETAFRVPPQAAAVATPTPLTPNTGGFWFFSADNLELVVKVLDGRPVNGKWWVFYGALSNVEYTITVTDTQTGAVKTYFNPQGQLASVADTTAF